MTLEESREIIPLMEAMIGQIEEQQTLMTETVSYTHLARCPASIASRFSFSISYPIISSLLVFL